MWRGWLWPKHPREVGHPPDRWGSEHPPLPHAPAAPAAATATADQALAGRNGSGAVAGAAAAP